MATRVTLSVYESSYSIASNTSKVNITFSVTTEGATYNESGDTSGYVKLDGKQIANLAGKRFSKNTTTTLYSGQHTVAHNTDGTKSISVEAGFDLNTSSFRWLYDSKTLQLTTIPRASSVSASNLVIGESGRIKITRASSGFLHTITYSIGSASGTILTKTDKVDFAWTPPVSLLNQLPSSTSGKITITCITFSAGKEIGRKSVTSTISVPTSVVPKITSFKISPVNTNDFLVANSIYASGYTKARVQTNATAGQGSKLDRIEITGIGSGTGSDWTSRILQGGDFVVTATAYDNRGRKAVATQKLSVYSYSSPVITNSKSFRCNSNGEAASSGEFISVLLSAQITSLGGKNTAKLSVRSKTTTGYWGQSTDLVDGVATVLPGFSAQRTYEVELSVTDSLGNIKRVSYVISTDNITLHLRNGGDGIAFGKYSEKKDTFECNYQAEFIHRVHATELYADNIKDFVVQKGTDGIWSYQKWHSGRVDCWGTLTFRNVDVSQNYGSMKKSSTLEAKFPSGLFSRAPTEFDSLYSLYAGLFLIKYNGPNTDRTTVFSVATPLSAMVVEELEINVYATGI